MRDTLPNQRTCAGNCRLAIRDARSRLAFTPFWNRAVFDEGSLLQKKKDVWLAIGSLNTKACSTQDCNAFLIPDKAIGKFEPGACDRVASLCSPRLSLSLCYTRSLTLALSSLLVPFPPSALSETHRVPEIKRTEKMRKSTRIDADVCFRHPASKKKHCFSAAREGCYRSTDRRYEKENRLSHL